MADEVRYAHDLYRGTAAAYERYRLPYPAAMTADLVRSAQVSGRGRLLDLACGPGQLRLRCAAWSHRGLGCRPGAGHGRGGPGVAVATAGAWNLRPVVSGAETLGAQPEYFELAVIGNAFHPGWTEIWPLAGSPAGSSARWPPWRCAGLPSPGPVSRSLRAAGSGHSLRRQVESGARRSSLSGSPARTKARSRRPDSEVLTDAGFELAGSHELAISNT